MPEGFDRGPEADRMVGMTEAAPPPRRRRWLRPALMLAGVAVFAVAGGWFWLQGGRYASTDDAYVQADKLLVATDVSGIVQQIAVKEGDVVHKGDLLFRLDPAPFRNALDGARANLEQTMLTLKAAQADVQRFQRDVAGQEAAVQLANATYQRAAQIVNTGAVTRASYDQARFGLEQAQQQLESLRAQARVALAKLGGSAETPVEQLPPFLQAAAQVAEAQRQLDHTAVRASFAGTVTQVSSLQPGQFLAASTPAFALVSTEHVWVDALPKETDLTYARPGQAATVTVDTYPGVVFKGTVQSIAPASGNTFSVLPAQNSSGNWVKVVQRIPVRIAVDRPEGSPPLRTGMSVEVSIDTGHKRKISDLL